MFLFHFSMMKAFHCVLLFALIAFTSPAVDAADDNAVEVCEDEYICEGLIGNTMCQLKSAVVRANTSSYPIKVV